MATGFGDRIASGVRSFELDGAAQAGPSVDHRMDASAHDVADRIGGAAGRVGHDRDGGLRQVDKQLGRDVRQAAGGVGADDQLVRHLLGERDEFGERVDAELRRAGHHQALVGRQADRDHVRVHVERQLLVLRRQDHVDRCQGRKQRMAVGLLAEEGAGADDATAAGAVLDDHLLAPQLRQRLGDQPMPDIGRGARGQGHDDLHRPRRIGLGRRRLGDGQADSRWRPCRPEARVY